jgi:hypothetical protein
MRKLAATFICSTLILLLNGCTTEAPTPAATTSPSDAGQVATKKPAKRRPKLEAVTKQERATKPFSD